MDNRKIQAALETVASRRCVPGWLNPDDVKKFNDLLESTVVRDNGYVTYSCQANFRIHVCDLDKIKTGATIGAGVVGIAGAVAGAVTGAAVGSAIPVVGTAGGAIIGGVTGLVGGGTVGAGAGAAACAGTGATVSGEHFVTARDVFHELPGFRETLKDNVVYCELGRLNWKQKLKRCCIMCWCCSKQR